jgi:hypothetical protein
MVSRFAATVRHVADETERELDGLEPIQRAVPAGDRE